MEHIGISLQEYLIKYSEVDYQFVKDFIAIQQSDITKKYYPFVIDIELIIKWLHTDKKHLRRTLQRSYIQHVDYIILVLGKNKQRTGRGGHNIKTILVTVRCFKKICLKTRSFLSDKITDYYIALENLLIQYQEYIISVLINENKLLKNDLNNDIFSLGGLIYVMDLGNGYYKLGYTQDLKQRKRILETGHVHSKKIIFFYESDDIKSLEACAKGILLKYGVKKRKEVYQTELKQIINAIKGCSGVLSNLTCEICHDNINDLKSHFKHKHPRLLNKTTIFETNLNQRGAGKCVEYTHIKKNYDGDTYLVEDRISNHKYIVKVGENVIDEVGAYMRLNKIEEFVWECLPEIYNVSSNKDTKEVLVLEHIEGYNGTDLDKIPVFVNKKNSKMHELAWIRLIYQLSHFIMMLEYNKIQHNDFHLANIMLETDIDNDNNSKCDCFQLKILDLETVTDYKKGALVYSSIVKYASDKQMKKFGWNNNFHPGSDLNQILGELIEKYHNIMPKNIVDEISPRIIKHNKKYQFAIHNSNKLTTGDEIMGLIFKLMAKSRN